MKFKILHDKSCVLSVEEPVPVGIDIEVSFDGAADSTYAIVRIGDSRYFRPIVGGVITVPCPKESGTMFVTYVEHEKPYECTPIDVMVTSEQVLLRPNLSKFNDDISELKIKYNELCDKLKELEDKLQHLADKFDEIYEGYNVI